MKRRRTYDFVFALGSGCICTDVLREAGLQVEAFPMDWVGRQEVTRPIGQVMRDRTDIFISEFEDLLSLEHMERDAEHPSDGRHDHYNNTANGQAFFHDFPAGVPLEESFPVVREKYDRRATRFLRRLSRARRVLMVWLGDTRDVGRIGHEDIRYALEAFSEKYPKAEFFLRVFECPAEFSPERREFGSGPKFACEAFDYRCHESGAPRWKIRNELVVERLGDCRLRDYRSLGERWQAWYRDYRSDRKRFGASSWMDLFLVKSRYRRYWKLKRQLEQRGLAV